MCLFPFLFMRYTTRSGGLFINHQAQRSGGYEENILICPQKLPYNMQIAMVPCLHPSRKEVGHFHWRLMRITMTGLFHPDLRALNPIYGFKFKTLDSQRLG